MTALPIPLDPRVVAAGLAAVLAGEGLRRSARETYNYLEDTTRRSNHNRPLTPPAPVTGSYERGDNNATEGAAAAHPTLFDLCSLTTPEFRSQLSQAIREPPMSIPSQEEGYSGIEIPFPFRVPCATSPPPPGGSFASDTESGFEYARKRNSSPPAAVATDSGAAVAAAAPPPENGDRKSKNTSAPTRKISKRQLERLLREDGSIIYKKIKQKAAAEFSKGSDRTVWSNTDYRIDFDYFDSVRGIRHWNLQVNSGAKSEVARDLLKGGRTTHAEIYKGQFNAWDPPSLDAWERSILDGV